MNEKINKWTNKWNTLYTQAIAVVIILAKAISSKTLREPLFYEFMNQDFCVLPLI